MRKILLPLLFTASVFTLFTAFGVPVIPLTPGPLLASFVGICAVASVPLYFFGAVLDERHLITRDEKRISIAETKFFENEARKSVADANAAELREEHYTKGDFDTDPPVGIVAAKHSNGRDYDQNWLD